MKINVVAVCKNEGRILPFFLDHYSQFCDSIMLCDGHSTDNTKDIVATFPKAKLVYLDDGKELDDVTLLRIRNEYYKQFRNQYDWQIVCDVDEFLYNPNILEVLQRFKDQGITFPEVDGYQMGSKVFPKYGIPITKQVVTGERDISRYPGYTRKRIIFNPQKIDINYNMGCNYASPKGEVKADCDYFYNDPYKDEIHGSIKEGVVPELKVLHYKYLSYQHLIDKSVFNMTRISPHSILHSYGHHYEKLAKMTEEQYNQMVDKYPVVI